ncbi:MAG: hypothetical protein WCD83_07435, partial [Pseudolabrys sp.]
MATDGPFQILPISATRQHAIGLIGIATICVPQAKDFGSTRELPGPHDCPKCAFPMLLAVIEPSDQE